MLVNMYAVKKVKLVNNKSDVDKELQSEQQEKVILMKHSFIKRNFPCVAAAIYRNSFTAFRAG
jgi:hypothetical protein